MPEAQGAHLPEDLESLIAYALSCTGTERDAAIERFCRAHPSEDAIALRAVHLHQGTITAENASPGLRVRIVLPGAW